MTKSYLFVRQSMKKPRQLGFFMFELIKVSFNFYCLAPGKTTAGFRAAPPGTTVDGAGCGPVLTPGIGALALGSSLNFVF
jgi:hypothetical protein